MAIMNVSLHEACDYVVNHVLDAMDNGKVAEPVAFHSSPGVGKSAGVNFRIADALREVMSNHYNAKFHVWDVRIGSQMESDIQGTPYTSEVKGGHIREMFYSTPEWFPREGECGILFLDEISNAPIPNQHAAYRLVHDRTIHNGRKLPDGVIVIGAGNLKEDKTGAKGLLPALARRFQTHFYIKPSVEEFVSYGLEKGIHPAILGWVQVDGSNLYTPPMEGEYGFACPANLDSISDTLWSERQPERMRNAAIYGALGSVKGGDLIGYLKFSDYLPDFNEVMKSGHYQLPNISDSDRGIKIFIVSALTGFLATRLKEDADHDSNEKEKTDNLSAVYNSLHPSVSGVSIRALKRIDPKNFIKIMKQYPKLNGVLQDVLNQSRKLKN